MRPESARRIDAANDLHAAQARYRDLFERHVTCDPRDIVTPSDVEAAKAQCDAAREALEAAHHAEDEAIAAESA